MNDNSLCERPSSPNDLVSQSINNNTMDTTEPEQLGVAPCSHSVIPKQVYFDFHSAPNNVKIKTSECEKEYSLEEWDQLMNMVNLARHISTGCAF